VKAAIFFVFVLALTPLMVTNSTSITSAFYPPALGQAPLKEQTLVVWNDTLLEGNVMVNQNKTMPRAILYNPSNGYIYLAAIQYSVVSSVIQSQEVNETSSPMLLVNPSNNSIFNSVRVGLWPVAIAVDSAGDVYVAGLFSNSLTVFSPTNEEIASIPIYYCPMSMAFDPKNDAMYVADEFSGNLSVINATSHELVNSLYLGVPPYSVLYDPDNNCVYVASLGAMEIIVVNATNDRVVTTIAGNLDPISMAFDPKSGTIYVANYYFDDVAVINASNKVCDVIGVGSLPDALLYDPRTNTLFVANEFSDAVTEINASDQRVLGWITTGEGPVSMAYDPNNNCLYVANLMGTVTIISLPNNKGRAYPLPPTAFVPPFSLGLLNAGKKDSLRRASQSSSYNVNNERLNAWLSGSRGSFRFSLSNQTQNKLKISRDC